MLKLGILGRVREYLRAIGIRVPCLVFVLLLTGLADASEIRCHRVLVRDLNPYVTVTEDVFGSPLQYEMKDHVSYSGRTVESLGLENDFVISMAPNGHTLIWFAGWRIDSGGTVLISVKSYKAQGTVLPSGVLFVKKNISDEFRERFDQYLHEFESHRAGTCTVLACRTLQELGLEELAPQKFFRTRSLLNHLVQYYLNLPSDEKQNYSIRTINNSLPKIIEEMKKFESSGVFLESQSSRR